MGLLTDLWVVLPSLPSLERAGLTKIMLIESAEQLGAERHERTDGRQDTETVHVHEYLPQGSERSNFKSQGIGMSRSTQ